MKWNMRWSYIITLSTGPIEVDQKPTGILHHNQISDVVIEDVIMMENVRGLFAHFIRTCGQGK